MTATGKRRASVLNFTNPGNFRFTMLTTAGIYCWMWCILHSTTRDIPYYREIHMCSRNIFTGFCKRFSLPRGPVRKTWDQMILRLASSLSLKLEIAKTIVRDRKTPCSGGVGNKLSHGLQWRWYFCSCLHGVERTCQNYSVTDLGRISCLAVKQICDHDV